MARARNTSDDIEPLEDAVYGQIRDAISSQKLAPGTRLREDEMRQIFSVSRARIRNVFSRLSYDGLVTITPNRGASVARPSVQEARDLFAARRAIEAAIVTSAAGRLGPSHKRRLREHLKREHEADLAHDHAAMVSLSGEFHLLLASISGNAMLEKFLRELVMRSSLAILAYERPGSPSCSSREHDDIFDALAGGDSTLALRLMLDHLAAVESRLDLDHEERPAVNLAAVFA